MDTAHEPPKGPLTPEARLAELQAKLDITNTLLGAVSSNEPVRTLVTRLGVLSRGTAIIYDFEGNVIASTGEAPSQLIWNEVSATSKQELSFEVGRWFVRTRRIALRVGLHVIAIASRGNQALDDVGEILLDTAERLLGAVYGIQHGATQRDRRDNEQLLAALQDGILPSREHRFWARLNQFRFPSYTELRMLECIPISGESANESHTDLLLTKARAEGIPLLITLRRTDIDAPATVSALTHNTPTSEAWIDSLETKMLVGASAPFTALAQVPSSMLEAETALGIARTHAVAQPNARVHKAVRIDRIDLTTWMLSHVDKRALDAYISRVLKPLEDQSLVDTLVTYLAAEQNISVTAEALFIHQNTVRYRLNRIEKLIGSPIAAVPTISNLVLALYPQILGRSEELRTRDEH
jgi:hypothetical protein